MINERINAIKEQLKVELPKYEYQLLKNQLNWLEQLKEYINNNHKEITPDGFLSGCISTYCCHDDEYMKFVKGLVGNSND